MSQTPQNLPKRTRVLVKDILFQEKYQLSHTQVDIMSYILNALTWTLKIGAFFPLSNKKFKEDLPQISEKTLEESLRALKAMKLIEVEMISVPQWNNAYVRGISILPKGLEYNSSYYHVEEIKIIETLNHKLSSQEKKILELIDELETVKTEKGKEKEEEGKNEKEEIEKEKTKQLEEILEEESEIEYETLSLKELIETVTQEFGKTFEPICNGVKGWQKEVKFYINSYKKLSVEIPNGDIVQVKSPLEINNFWKYLEQNRQQIGKVIDFSKTLEIEALNTRYKGLHVLLKDEEFIIYKIEKAKAGAYISLKNTRTGDIVRLSKDGKSIVFGLEKCEKVLLGLRG